mgnify:CR=1 FL=1
MKVLSDISSKKKAGPGGEEGADADGEDLQLDSIGCTANVVMVDYARSKIFVANAGDSRSVMGRDGTAIPLSFDHKPENETEINRIYAAGSVIQEGRVDGHLNLTRALGDLKFKVKEGLTPEEFPITANPDVLEFDFDAQCDFILMGCDGVWEQKSNDEMVAWVYKELQERPDRSQETLRAIVQKLLHEQLSPNHQETGKWKAFCEPGCDVCRGPGLRQHDVHLDCLQKVKHVKTRKGRPKLPRVKGVSECVSDKAAA